MSDSFHVLVVDQNRMLCQALEPVLAEAGCRVDCLSGTVSPFAAIRELSPDLVIMEIVSTNVQGLDTLRRLESRRTAEKIPVIVTSPKAELEYELPDVFDFLPQPLDQQRLLEDITLLVEKNHTSRRGSVPYASLNDEELGLFQDFLVTHSGLHFDRRNIKLLERGLMRRMRAINAKSYRDYFHYLSTFRESREELKKLLALLTVGETFFFRYLAHFEALIHHVVPEILERNRRQKTLRIWSAGCSTGEEAYSIAMVLLEHFPQLADWQVSILATDINKQSLRKARQGVFSPRSLRVTDAFYRSRYFHSIGTDLQLDERVRKMVRFTYLNLQTGRYPNDENGTTALDMLFCRNVLIYFGLPTTRLIIERFTRCLRPAGFLFLGHAETLMSISSRFQRIQNNGGFYYRLVPEGKPVPKPVPRPLPMPAAPPLRTTPKPVVLDRPPSAVPQPLPKPPPLPPPPVVEEQAPDIAEVFQQAEQAFNRENFKTASQNYDIILRLDGKHVGALVGKGFIHANQGEFETALDYCGRALAVDDLCPPAYFLRGLISELRDDLPLAVEEYRKALLLAMDFIMARYNLSKVFRRLGRADESRRELKNSLRLLEKAPDEAIIPFSGGLSRAVFLEICRDEAAQGA